MSTERVVLEAVHAEFLALRALAEQAAAPLDDRAFFARLDDTANSIAVLMKHVGGNLWSRWTDPFATDGEKPERRRDQEFVQAGDETRAEVEARWNRGWTALFQTLSTATDGDLGRTIRVRGEALTLARGLTRSLAHTAGHVHQIVLLAKHWRAATPPGS